MIPSPLYVYLALARQVLYHVSHTPPLLYVSYFLGRVLYFSQDHPQTVIFLPVPAVLLELQALCLA
jgi:hypothetical protein